MPWRGEQAEYEATGLRYPTLGVEAVGWIEENCVIPDGDQQGDPFRLTNEMVRFLLQYYRIHPDGWSQKHEGPRFQHERGGQLVRPQKWGKGPFSAAIICFEAVGPCVPAGWDADGAIVGRPWQTPTIQVTALSEEQTDNVFRALIPMIQLGALNERIPDTGITRVNLPGGGIISPVTASARSRLGQRLTFAVEDETHGWTERSAGIRLADTQRRNMAGMGGRWIETTNAWDITEGSVAQLTYESPIGVYVDYPQPIGGSIRNKAERRRAMRHAYGDSVRNGKNWKGWVDLDRIDIEIEALSKRDPAQAERFFLNRVHAGEDVIFDVAAWADAADPAHVVADNALISIGVDGARREDDLAIIATELETFHQWPLFIASRPEFAGPDYEHDLEAADAAIAAAFDRYDVALLYADPQGIYHLVDRWIGRYGKERCAEWFTNQPSSRKVGHAVANYVTAVANGDMSHDGDSVFTRHILNARRKSLSTLDDDGRPMYSLQKDRPHSRNKIDAAMAAMLSCEARSDAIAKGALNRRHRWFMGV